MTSFPTALHHRIHALAQQAPDAPALVSCAADGERCSRGELDARAARLAARLRAAGVTTEVRVGVCVERGCDLFVALLAVLKAGGAFVPLDPRHPAARLDWIARDAALVHGIVDEHADSATRARFAHCLTVARDDDSEAGEHVGGDGGDTARDAFDNDASVHPRAAAYLIYTSGSTGTPKAVVVEHGPLAAHCDALAAALPITPDDRLLHFASVSFDAAHECWLAPLAVGASIVIADSPPFPPDAAHALIARERVTVAAFPPAYLREFAAHAQRAGVPASLRVLAFGGEATSRGAFDQVRRTFPGVRLVNGYGPTEAVISPMLWPLAPGADAGFADADAFAALPIGRPIGPRVARIDHDRAAEVAHASNALREAKRAGELLLGGACVARGYHGRPALTAERFVPDPLGAPGERVYRTGDLVRVRDDGAYDYLGRVDDQVQIRGVRVEPGEIAACLLAHPQVDDAAVFANVRGARTQLVACIVADAALDDAALAGHVRARLPRASQPHRFVRFERLPYHASGKLDRRALKDEADMIAARTARVIACDAVPQTATERSLAACWQRLLGDPAGIGRDDRFIGLGGDSLGVMQLQAAIRETWRVNLRLDRLFDDPTLADLAALIERSEPEAGAIARVIPRTAAAVPGAPYEDHPASYAQQRFWVLAQTQRAGAAYQIAARWDIDGMLDRAALERALALVIERHDAWRTTLIENDDGVVMQRVHAALPVPMPVADLRGIDLVERDARAAALAERDAAAPFDLSNGPLVRATLVVLADDHHRLLLTVHHAVSDGWSSRCAFDELAAAYTAFATGGAPALPPLPIRYADYARWQRARIDDDEGARQLAYWRSALADAPGPLALPVDRAQPARRDHRGARVSAALAPDVAAAVRALARRLHTSPFVVLLAAFDAWLHRLTGETDLVVAVPVADRRLPETTPLIGLFLNTIALRARIVPSATFVSVVESVRAALQAALVHQDVPFERVVDAVKPNAPRGDAWLRVKFAQQFDAARTFALPGATAVAAPGPDLAARFDLALDFTDDPTGITLTAAHALDCIAPDTACAWLASYAALVADAVRDPARLVAAVDCAGGAAAGRRNGRPLDTGTDVLARFACHAAAASQRIAVADAHAQLTYAELDDASNRIAAVLAARGAGAERPVAICIERSAAFVAAFLGVLKSGAYAVLLDPAMPAARVASALGASDTRIVLVSARVNGEGSAACTEEAARPERCAVHPRERVSGGGADGAGARFGPDSDRHPDEAGSIEHLDIDSLIGDPALANATVHDAIRSPQQAAYLIFTSGSTGAPKGVVVSHRALADYVDGLLDELAFAPDASMAMVSTVAADLGHTTLFGALCSGRSLHLLPADCAFDPDRFADEMRARNVGVLKIVPSHLQALLDAHSPADVLPSHALVCGGEVLAWGLVERVAALKPGCRVINHYGPTEACVGALACDTTSPGAASLRAAAQPGDGVPLGAPLPNAQAWVFDAALACVPPGAIGELYLGGPGLARGYLGRPGATAERFVPHPYGAPGARLYRTGDRVRLRADGLIAFVGRADDQVKIRGYRVEPGEVGAVLSALDGVNHAHVVAVAGTDGRMRLAAFAALADGAAHTADTLRDALAARLPDYMVPATLAVLAALPVTANGKIDRAVLAALADAPAQASAPADAPQGFVQTVLAEVWRDVLKVERVGRDDDFFTLGGDSILVLQVIARARKRGVRFTPKQLFDAPSVAQLARVAVVTEDAARDGRVSGNGAEAGVIDATAARLALSKAFGSSIRSTDIDAHEQNAMRSETADAANTACLALTPAQHRFFSLDVPHSGHWNQAVAFDAHPGFDPDAFARALDALLSHHTVFRQRFVRDPRTRAWRSHYAPRAFDTLPFVMASARDDKDALAQFDTLQAALDIGHGPLACALASTLADGRVKAYVAIHHLIVDGVSWRVLLDDLDCAYRAALEGRIYRLDATGACAPDWAARLERAARDPQGPFAHDTAHWLALAAPDHALPPDLPLDRPLAGATNADAAVVVQTLDADLTRAALADAHAAYRTNTAELLIAALAQALAETTGGDRCRIELEGHGREALFDDVDASRSPGWLTSHYPVELPVSADVERTLTAVKDALRAVPHKGLGFGVLRHAGDDAQRTALARILRPRVTFNYLGRFDVPRDALLVPRFGGAGRERDPAGPLGNALAIHAHADGDGARTLTLHWVYGATQFDRATIESLAERFARALAAMAAACARRLATRGGGATPTDYPLARAAGLTQTALDRLPLDLRTVDDLYPLSPMQQGILFHSLLAPHAATYVNQLVATLDAPDVERLAAAFDAAVPRHDILRTSFTPDEAAPMQIVHRHARLPIERLDWRGGALDTPDAPETPDTLGARLDAWLADDRARGFDLRTAPLMRVTLIRVTDETWRLVWTRHHLLLDGWSTARLLAQVLRDYAAPPRPQPFAPRADVRYRDFIAWLSLRDIDADNAFWRDRVARLAAPTLVATPAGISAGTDVDANAKADTKASKSRPRTDYRTLRRAFDRAAAARIVDAARRTRVSVNTLVQGAWALALQRTAHRETVAFGATVAGRPHAIAGIETVLGLFINTLPVIATPAPHRAADDWLRELQREFAASAEHAQMPLADIQRLANTGGGALFDTLVVFENYPLDSVPRANDPHALGLRDIRNIEATDFAVTLVIDAGDTLTVDYGYDAARIDLAQVAVLADAFAACVDALATAGDAPLGTIAVASGEACERVARWNATDVEWRPEQRLPLHRQFERIASAAPDAIALEIDGAGDATGAIAKMSYGELNARANRVAHALVEQGVAPDTPVALCVERSFDMVVALFGILKAGAAYLPIDPDYPSERIAYLIDDARPALVLTQPHLYERVASVAARGGARVLDIERLVTRGDALASANLRMDIAPEQLAYLIYTSGSTGKPKGAGNTHRALANRIAWMQHAYRLTRDDVVLHKTPFGFDVSVWEFVWPLSTGATLAIAMPGDHRDPARLVSTIDTHRVSTLHFVPSMLAAFVAALDVARDPNNPNDHRRCASVTRVIASGEALAPELVARVARQLPHARLYNLYGPTEAAIDVSHWTCTPDDARASAVPIGHPIANLQLHVLDVALQPLPAGATGELYLGGDGLARGYLGRPALTAERFVPDPFRPGARLYRTGDLVRRRADGALDYLGRIDAQVKLRGQRIEPGEIEALLRAARGVHDAVVVVRDGQLVGYVARDPNVFDRAVLADSLRAQLPAYMVPAHLVELDEMPVTPNGKCDRRALPAPTYEARAIEPSATPTEHALAAIWRDVLGIDAIGRDDDFFALGGHSLLATQANARANLHWALALPLRTLFDERTLASCAAAIDRALAARGSAAAGDAARAIDALLGELESQ